MKGLYLPHGFFAKIRPFFRPFALKKIALNTNSEHVRTSPFLFLVGGRFSLFSYIGGNRGESILLFLCRGKIVFLSVKLDKFSRCEFFFNKNFSNVEFSLNFAPKLKKHKAYEM